MTLPSRLLGLPVLLLPLAAGAHDSEAQQPFRRIHAHQAPEGHFHTGWESRYASEGRDVLDGDSLWTTSFELGWDHWFGGAWYGKSPDQRYDELHLGFGWTQSLAHFDYFLGYTHLRTPFDGAHDHEIAAGLVWTTLPWELELALEGYHSFDASGSFWELGLGRSFEPSGRLILNAGTFLGVNQGYISDGHDGTNHLALRLSAACALTESWALTAHAAYNFALDREVLRPGDAQLTDFFHAGFGVEWSF